MSTAPVKYNALIVDTDLDRRMRLKSATTSVVQFGKVNLLNDLDDAKNQISGGKAFDVIFVSSIFEQGPISEFIKSAKELEAARDAAYVLVLQTKDQESSNVASNVMIGADGMLFEPYSVDSLVEITELAAQVKKDRSLQREQAAIGFLLDDVLQQIDMLAYLKSAGYDVGRGIRRFKQMCSVFETLEKDSKQLYYNIAIEKFSNAPFPKKMYQKNYSGASKRVKERMEKKLLAKLEEGLVDDRDSDSEQESATS